MRKGHRVSRIHVICAVCGKGDNVLPSRADRYKTCSRHCRSILAAKRFASTAVYATCSHCGHRFKTKQSHLTRRNYCSKPCQAKAYAVRYCGSNNPNFKGVLVTKDGYRVSLNMKGTHRSLHREIVAQFFGVDFVPKRLIVHHRDCNKLNNEYDNLVILSRNDHRWLHSQFGSAILWAYANGKISKDVLASWSDDRERAGKLLSLKISEQKGVINLSESK